MTYNDFDSLANPLSGIIRSAQDREATAPKLEEILESSGVGKGGKSIG